MAITKFSLAQLWREVCAYDRVPEDGTLEFSDHNPYAEQFRHAVQAYMTGEPSCVKPSSRC